MSRAEQAAAEVVEALQRERGPVFAVWERAFVVARAAYLERVGPPKRPWPGTDPDGDGLRQCKADYLEKVAGIEREAAMRATVAALRECFPDWRGEAQAEVAAGGDA